MEKICNVLEALRQCMWVMPRSLISPKLEEKELLKGWTSWSCKTSRKYLGAIINLSVQVSHRHRNSWKAHILPQKVYKSANWNESSVEWTLVDLDFAFVMISNFEVVPQPRK